MRSSSEKPAQSRPFTGGKAVANGLLILVVLLLVLSAGAWLLDGAQAVKTGDFAHPLSVRLEGADDTALAGITVRLVSPRGNLWRLERVTGQPEWVSRRQWARTIRIECPQEALGHLGVRLAAGEVAYVWDESQFPADWIRLPAENASSDRVALEPCALEGPGSRLSFLQGLANYPGDAALLKRVFLDPGLFRVAVLLVVLALAGTMRRSSSQRSDRWNGWIWGTALVVLLGYAFGMVVPVIATRIGFPLPVEHLEGVQATGVLMWMKGYSLYTSPSIEHCSNIYTPGYYILCRMWSWLFGLTLPSLRALTLLLVIGSAGIALDLARRLTGSVKTGLLWLPCYLLLFDYYGWIDNANKDALHVFLAMAGMDALAAGLDRGRKGWWMPCILSGVLWALAFMTKQSHAVVCVPVYALMLLFARPQLWVSAGSLAITTAALQAAALGIWGPAYWDWCFTIPKGHGLIWGQLVSILVEFGLLAAGFFVVAACAFLPENGHGRDEARRTLLGLVAAFALGGFLMGAMSCAKDRGGAYALIAGMAALCVLVSVGFFRLRGTPMVHALLLLALPMTLPFDRAVTRTDWTACDRITSIVRDEPGEVWLPFHPWTTAHAGKTPLVPLFCVGEWVASGRSFPEAVLEGIRAQRPGLIVTDFNLPNHPPLDCAAEPFPAIAESYLPVEVLPAEDACVVKDGWTNIPRVLWRPRP